MTPTRSAVSSCGPGSRRGAASSAPSGSRTAARDAHHPADLVAVDADGVFAFVAWDEASGEITRLYTDPPAQGRGAGAALLGLALDALREAGCRQAWLNTEERNEAAVRFSTSARVGGSRVSRGSATGTAPASSSPASSAISSPAAERIASEPMRYRRIAIEIESPEALGYDAIANNLVGELVRRHAPRRHGIDTEVGDLLLQYGDHRGLPRLREQIAADAAPSTPTMSSSPQARLRRCSSSPRRCSRAGDHVLVRSPNYATNLETRAPRRRRRAISSSASRTTGRWTSSGSRRCCAPRPGSSASPTPTTRPGR